MVYAFMALGSSKNVNLAPDSFFDCTYLAYLLQYMLMLAIHEARGLRQGCFLIFLGAPPVG